MLFRVKQSPYIKTKCFSQIILFFLTLGHTRKVILPPWYKGGGGAWEVDLPTLDFFICCSIRNDFAVSGKPFIFSTR